ncbi:hypothetical protein M9H77_32111 [Catharanthus roseus]|uniref:Uncharacterized protein n=1 Tax=Catharanthus roseus TaxID=4058 RepID=A0ACC0A2C1_CATRO|nr:hypothetical protein M9H77_32111 [Catharanthus roseus]
MQKSAIFKSAFLLLFSISWSAASAKPINEFIRCVVLNSGNPTAASQVIFAPNNASYLPILNSKIQNFQYARPNTPKPLVIITPNHESQIQAAIHCSKKFDLQIRIRSGGHDFSGASYVSLQSPFFMLDMSNFRSISIDVKSRTAWLGVAARLGEVYYSIYQANSSLYFPGGSCTTVEIGGLVSGGGYGPFVRKYGLAADTVIDARVVDANGRILDRKSMGEDFFWAIRGGNGASFGVIISYKVKLVETRQNFTAFNISRTLEQNAIQLLYKWQYVAPKVPRDLSITAIFFPGSAAFLAFFQGDVDTLLSLMKEYFPELGVTKEDCEEIRWIDNYAYQYGLPIQSTNEILLSGINLNLSPNPYFKGKSDFVQKPIPEIGIRKIWNLFLQRNVQDASMEFTPFGGIMNEIPVSKIPFPHRAGTLYLVVNVASWNSTNTTSAKKGINWSRKLYRIMGKYIPNTPNNPRGAYVNYRDFDLGTNNPHGYTSVEQARIWGAHYFKSNFDRLVKVKTIVDPKNFFNFEQSIPPNQPWSKQGILIHKKGFETLAYIDN